MAAQPSIFVVAPKGTANEAYSRGTPRRSTERWVTGMVPTEERDTKASSIAGQAPAKKRSGLRRPARISTSG